MGGAERGGRVLWRQARHRRAEGCGGSETDGRILCVAFVSFRECTRRWPWKKNDGLCRGVGSIEGGKEDAALHWESSSVEVLQEAGVFEDQRICPRENTMTP